MLLRHFVPLAAAVVAAGSSCVFDQELPGDARIDCISDGECATGLRCEQALGRCVGIDETLPLAVAATVQAREDEPLAFRLGASDLDGDTLTFELVQEPAHGTLLGLDDRTGDVTYRPAADFFGADALSFVVHDDSATSGEAIVVLEVAPVSDAPVIVPVSLDTDEDQADGVEVEIIDPDGEDVELTVTTPGLAVVELRSAFVLYVPAADFFGADVVEVTADDHATDPVFFPIPVTVRPVNDAPAIVPTLIATQEDVPAILQVEVTDVDDAAGDVVLSVVGAPNASAGTATVEPGTHTLTFTPAPNYAGDDVVTLIATDVAGAVSEVIEVPIAVIPTVDAAVAEPATLVLDEDTTVELQLEGFTVDNVDLDFAVVSPPDHGTLSFFSAANGSVRYTPAADFNGTDSFVFEAIHDGTAGTSASITLVVAPVSDAPILVAESNVTNEDTALARVLAAADPDGDVLGASVLVGPLHGDVDIVGLEWVYTPDPDYFGPDQLEIEVTDGTRAASAVFPIDVAAVPDVPVAIDLAAAVDEDAFVVLDLAGSSADLDAVTFVLTSAPQRGTVSLLNAATGSVLYTPEPDANGADSFEFVVRNSASVVSAPAVTTVTIRPLNDAPAAHLPPSAVVTEDVEALIPFSITDADNDATTLTVLQAPRNGVLFVQAGALRYVPNRDFNGIDELVVGPRDANGPGETVRVALTITAVPDAPVAFPASITVLEDGSQVFALAAATVDGGDLDFIIVANPLKGTIDSFDPETGVGLYRPATNRNGSDGFSVVAQDASGLVGAPATVSVSITPVNDAPTIDAIAVTTSEDSSAAFAVTVRDVENDPVAVTIVANGSKGVASFVGTSQTALTYVPAANQNGADAITLRPSDAAAGPSIVIPISILAVPDAPIAQALSLTVNEDATVPFALAAVSPDGAGISYRIVAPPQRGTITNFNASTGVGQYEPFADFHGADAFVWAPASGLLEGASKTVAVTINSVNDPPTLQPRPGVFDALRFQESSIEGFVMDDVDGDVPGLIVVQQPADGQGVANAAGSALTFSAQVSDLFVGTVAVSVAASDGKGGTSAPIDVLFRVVAGESCAALRASGVTTSGLYNLDDGVRRYLARCDLSTQGGGWTLVARMVERWDFEDPLWEGSDELLAPELIEDPQVNADLKAEAWALAPAADQLLVETFALDRSDRRTMVVEVAEPAPLSTLFATTHTERTNIASGTWISTFAGGQTPTQEPCFSDGFTAGDLSALSRCRLCAVQGRDAIDGVCTSAKTLLGLGIDFAARRNVGALGSIDARRLAALWVRSEDFFGVFAKERTCAAHGLGGRALSGVYNVEDVPTFCAF